MTNSEFQASIELEISRILNQLEIDSQRIVDSIRIKKNKVEYMGGKKVLDDPILVRQVEIVLYPDYEMARFSFSDDGIEFLHKSELWFQDWLNEIEKNNGQI